jgi:hypothetical protein
MTILNHSPHKSFRVTQLVESVAICEALGRDAAALRDRFGWGNGTDTEPAFLVYPGCREDEISGYLNLRPHLELIHSVVDFDKPLFHYHYRCSLYRGGEMVGSGDGCCNSMEVKYQKQKHRIYDLTNTICKIAQKRALVAAVLSSCGASEFFTQDLDD